MGKLRPGYGGRRLDIKGEKQQPVGGCLWHANSHRWMVGQEPVMSHLSQKLSERCRTQSLAFSLSLL